MTKRKKNLGDFHQTVALDEITYNQIHEMANNIGATVSSCFANGDPGGICQTGTRNGGIAIKTRKRPEKEPAASTKYWRRSLITTLSLFMDWNVFYLT